MGVELVNTNRDYDAIPKKRVHETSSSVSILITMIDKSSLELEPWLARPGDFICDKTTRGHAMSETTDTLPGTGDQEVFFTTIICLSNTPIPLRSRS